MTYPTVIAESVRRKLKYHRSSTFRVLPHTEIIDPINKFRHSARFGSTGKGKSTNLLNTTECRLSQGFKVVMFDTQDELEFCSLPCPKDHPIYRKLRNRNRAPRGMKSRVLLPLAYEGGERVIQHKKIPKNWHFFLLDLFDLEVTSQDWNVLTGGLSGVQEQILKSSLLRKQPDWGVLDVYLETQKTFLEENFGYPDINVDEKDSAPIPVVKSVFPKQSITTLNRELMELNSARFLVPHSWRGHRTPHLLNWEKEITDRRTITIIKVSLLPPRLRHALCTYLLRKTFLMAQKRYLEDGRMVPPVSIMVPEATDFFPKRIPDEYGETLPPLRETFRTIFRRGRRHKVVIDYDTAYFQSIEDEIVNQTHYVFTFDNDKEILNTIINGFNPLNKKNLVGNFDFLKEQGVCLYLSRHRVNGMFIRDTVPACWVPLEGQNFLEIWRGMNGNFKDVDPYYETVNRIHADSKARVRRVFKKLKERMEMAKKMPLSGSAERFARYIYERSDSEQKTKFELASEIVNPYFEKVADSPSKVTLYNICKKLHKLNLITMHREKKPYTLTVNTKKMKTVFEKQREITPARAEG